MIEIRQVVASDELEELATLADAIARQDGVAIPECLSMVGTQPEALAIGAFEDGVAIGFATAIVMRPPEMAVAVRPECRRRGVASMLMRRMREILWRDGNREALMVSDQASLSGQAFLKRIGADYRFSEMRLERTKQPSLPATERPDLVVRQATASDREELIGILAAAFGDESQDTDVLVDEGLAETERGFAIGFVGGEPIGIVRVGAWGGLGDITALGVVPDWRGKGYGRALLIWAVSALEAAGHDRIALEVATENQNALGLYQSCGFLVTNEFTYSRIAMGI